MAAAMARVPFRAPWRGEGSLGGNLGSAVTREVIRSFMGYSTSLPIEEFRSIERLLDGLCPTTYASGSRPFPRHRRSSGRTSTSGSASDAGTAEPEAARGRSEGSPKGPVVGWPRWIWSGPIGASGTRWRRGRTSLWDSVNVSARTRGVRVLMIGRSTLRSTLVIGCASLGLGLLFLGCARPTANLADATAATHGEGTVIPARIETGTWDRLVVVGPYSSQDQVASVAGIDRDAIPNSGVFSSNDGICLILYVSGARVAAFEEPSRMNGDYCADTDGTNLHQFPRNVVFEKGDASSGFGVMKPRPG